ncbi:polysaccharide deacetylase family protein [Hamadaea sp.]|uniref:polysaccharide deacetylase family protein n=1 Tax=Hamadaea sp. TaxID=2024425 RepID=UPI0025C579C6|nr:polysaccharide deacetylase family protein [Hamadaea sp.]
MPPIRSRRVVPVLLGPILAVALLITGLIAGCTATPQTASPGASGLGSPTPEISSLMPSPSAAETPSPRPTPSPTRKPSPKPSATSSRTESGALSCRSTVPLVRSPATGHGPAGSISVTGTQNVALTFDDGPDPINTPKMLDMLKQCGVKATFCLVGFRARDHPDLVRRIVAEGHTVCNHSWQHLLDLAADERTDAYIKRDLEHTNQVIHAAAPDAKIRYFRAPGGNFTPRLVQIAKDLGMTSIYWSLDPRDWESSKYGTGAQMTNHVISAIESGVRPGSIVLSHDNGKPTTIAAYRVLLPWLKARFRLVALPTDT